MFGMLDYRAHKLYWLLSLPVWALNWILVIVSTVAACAVAAQHIENVFGRFFAAFLLLQLFGLLLFAVQFILQRLLDGIFGFLVDVVPEGGRSREEAMKVVKGGEVAILNLKPLYEWTDEDVDRIDSKLGLFHKMFFRDQIRDRFEIMRSGAQEMKDKEDRDLSEFEIKQTLREMKLSPTWIERVLTDPYLRGLVLTQALFVVVFFGRVPGSGVGRR